MDLRLTNRKKLISKYLNNALIVIFLWMNNLRFLSKKRRPAYVFTIIILKQLKIVIL